MILPLVGKSQLFAIENGDEFLTPSILLCQFTDVQINVNLSFLFFLKKKRNFKKVTFFLKKETKQKKKKEMS